MLCKDLILAAAVIIGIGVALAVACQALFAAFCRHREITRYWFKGHYYAVVCKRCKRQIGEGRDKSHRYPDEARVARRGGRA